MINDSLIEDVNVPETHDGMEKDIEAEVHQPLKEGPSEDSAESSNTQTSDTVAAANLNLCDVDDEYSASIGEAEVKENVDPSYGGELSEGFTKKGVPRKRRKFENSPDLRRQLKAQKDKQDHEVKLGCGMNCKKKCSQNIPEERRRDINTQFWGLKRSDRNNFILQNISKANVARRTIIACENQFERNTTIRYHLA
ncbi:hypothetical protein JTB14_017920 [Gonioctena quinquepunctata]|nr:hypothetical protein JTB14_017920 [Gonioctena quinquepunctata]